MGIEIEKKYRIDGDSLGALTDRLAELDAVFSYEHFEENYLHRGGVLDSRDAALRIRKTDRRSTLTYKEKMPTESDFKRQIEFETDVADVEALESIIAKLGYELSLVYEKHRKAWTLGDVEVVLDELPFGFYMEIEGSPDDIAKAEELLCADRFVLEKRGYPTLTREYGTETDGVIQARFPIGSRPEVTPRKM